MNKIFFKYFSVKNFVTRGKLSQLLTRLKFYKNLSIFYLIYFRRVSNASKMRYQHVGQRVLAR
jgi:hypothetical protein